jgi:hypothetical protein
MGFAFLLSPKLQHILWSIKSSPLINNNYVLTYSRGLHAPLSHSVFHSTGGRDWSTITFDEYISRTISRNFIHIWYQCGKFVYSAELISYPLL